MPRESKLNIVPRFYYSLFYSLGERLGIFYLSMIFRYLYGLVLIAILGSCSTSGKLQVAEVNYQSLRTEYAQPLKVPETAKIAVEYFFNDKGEMQPVVYNLSKEIMIVDQTKSFVIMPNGQSVSYYDPNIYTTSTGTFESTTKNQTFNLGAIANALGIGGVAGSLMGGVTAGVSNTDGIIRQNSVSRIDQPMVNIGPQGSIAMSKAYRIEGIGDSGLGNSNYIDVELGQAPVKFSICISYSIDEGKTFEKLITKIYINSNINEKVTDKKISKAFNNIYARKPDALVENLFMFLVPNNIKRSTSDIMGEFLEHSNIYDNYIRGSLIDFQ